MKEIETAKGLNGFYELLMEKKETFQLDRLYSQNRYCKM